jgi:phospholipase/carboxylesterase
MPRLSGPRLMPHSGPPKQLVVLLHGYCADGSQLIGIGRQWQPQLPAAVFVAPDAADPCTDSSVVRQWFSLTTREPAERWRGVTQARPVLDEFLDETLQAYSLDESRLAIVGFSQGAEMALHVGLRRKQPPAAIIGFSGILVGPEHLDETVAARQSASRPRVLLVHGDHDDVIPVNDMLSSADRLAAAGIPCERYVSAGVGHALDESGLQRACGFLVRCFDQSSVASKTNPEAQSGG